jgi:hypothetical protein
VPCAALDSTELFDVRANDEASRLRGLEHEPAHIRLADALQLELARTSWKALTLLSRRT